MLKIQIQIQGELPNKVHTFSKSNRNKIIVVKMFYSPVNATFMDSFKNKDTCHVTRDT